MLGNITTPIQQQIVSEKNSKSIVLSYDNNKQQIETDISRANHTKLDNSTSSLYNSNNDDNKDIINKNYTEDEWEELTVAKRVHIINQRKINAYNKACEEFDKRIEDINKQIDKFGEWVPYDKAKEFLQEYTSLEINNEEDMEDLFSNLEKIDAESINLSFIISYLAL
jgi:hypothetical protein